MERIFSFPPLAKPGARVLILGSMPGVASLRAQQYYAHPHNQFWPIMGRILGFDPQTAYEIRCEVLVSSGLAIWDVLQSCVRPGSLDGDIDRSSIVANDFSAFFRSQPNLQKVLFNGSAAENLFHRRVLREQNIPTAIQTQRLPSTSPAHAGMRIAEKQASWRNALDLFLGL